MSIRKCFLITKSALRYNPVMYTFVRHHWNKDFKPGPFPTTENERVAAARRYNLPQSEYTPYPDDGLSGTGDYPKLPLISTESKDPFYPYDFPELKRNFQEPMHVEQDFIGEDRYDISKRHRIPGHEQWLQFFGVVGGLLIIFLAMNAAPMFHSLVPKQYPVEGKKHYTFEPSN